MHPDGAGLSPPFSYRSMGHMHLLARVEVFTPYALPTSLHAALS
jgi:hypothetical protein